jgi:sugar/nucleoside kinase (ribokinase family)
MGAHPREPDLDIVGFGALNVDYIAARPTTVDYFDELEMGEERHEQDFDLLQESIANLRDAKRHTHVQLGGSALNTLRALASLSPDLKLGFTTIAGGAPADLPPETDLSDLAGRLEIMVDWVGGPCGTCVSVLSKGERSLSTFNNRAASDYLGDEKYQERLVTRLARGRVVHVTSVFGAGAAKNVAHIMERVRARQPDVIFSVDLGHVWAGDPVARSMLGLADLVFLNDVELARLTPTPSSEKEEVREVERVESLLGRSSPRAPSRIMVLKKKRDAGRGPDYIGLDGAAMFHRSPGSVSIERREVAYEALTTPQIADSTGAGDVFAAGVLASLYSSSVAAESALNLGFSAARYKIQRPGLTGYRDLDSVAVGRAMRPGRGKIFISHDRRDVPIVKALEALFHAGSPRDREEQFFCSSLALQGPRPAKHLRRQIWQPMRGAELVIFVVTSSFLENRECTYELGAAAVLGLPPVPLLAPRLEFDNRQIPVSDSAGGYLDDRTDLTRIHGELSDQFGYEAVDHRVFESLVDDVLREAERLTVSPSFPLGGSKSKRRRTGGPTGRTPAKKPGSSKEV